jgi:membrane-bound metal-dependent hydrolase YbcI (DUF457 family)
VTEEGRLFAVGHLALGYVLGKGVAKLLKTRINIPVILTLPVISDADIPFKQLQLLQHRGPTHSIITAFIVFVPVFAIYRKRAIPYLVALISHPLIGDYVAGGRVQLLWPLSSQHYGIETSMRSPANIALEWTIFLISMIILLKTHDMAAFFRPQKSNLILFIPTLTILLPTLLNFPANVPVLLIPPHLVYLSIFSASIIVTVLGLRAASVKSSNVHTACMLGTLLRERRMFVLKFAKLSRSSCYSAQLASSCAHRLSQT